MHYFSALQVFFMEINLFSFKLVSFIIIQPDTLVFFFSIGYANVAKWEIFHKN